MEIAEILQQLERPKRAFPTAAVEAAIAQREKITPALLGILEDTINRAEELIADHDYMAHLFAMYLLALFRETRAYPLTLRFARLPSDALDEMSDEFTTDGLGRVLASVCGGDVEELHSLVEDESVDGWARTAGLDALVTLTATGQRSREETIAYFASLFRGKLRREWSPVWDLLVDCCVDLYPRELMADILKAYEDGCVDPGFVSFEDVERGLALGEDQVLADLAINPGRGFVEDIELEMERFLDLYDGRFDNGEGDDEEEGDEEDDWDSEAEGFDFGPEEEESTAPAFRAIPSSAPVPPVSQEPRVPITPFKRTEPKVGRNDPCPCGSGKKFKKCCGAA
jgi:hypothetical protein